MNKGEPFAEDRAPPASCFHYQKAKAVLELKPEIERKNQSALKPAGDCSGWQVPNN